MLVQVNYEVLLALELPLQLLSVHVVGITFLVCRVEAVHLLVRCRFKMIVGQHNLIKYSVAQVGEIIRAVAPDSFHIGRKSAA